MKQLTTGGEIIDTFILCPRNCQLTGGCERCFQYYRENTSRGLLTTPEIISKEDKDHFYKETFKKK